MAGKAGARTRVEEEMEHSFVFPYIFRGRDVERFGPRLRAFCAIEIV